MLRLFVVIYSYFLRQMRMKHFQKYLKHNTDDSPLYIFDSRFENDSVSRSLLEDYKVPDYFSEDLFSMVGEKKRPPYRYARNCRAVSSCFM